MPFGYSLFDQEDGGGFSIQIHEDRKFESFHILSVKPTAFVLLATPDEWTELDVDPAAFWGDEPPAHLAYRPEPGDVVAVDGLGVVHTVVGCILEEFATTSNDAVTRLHDQNEGVPTLHLPSRHVPLRQVLGGVTSFAPRRTGTRRPGGGWEREERPPGAVLLVDRPDLGLTGSHASVLPQQAWSRRTPAEMITTMVCLDGHVALEMGALHLELEPGDTVALLPGSEVSLTTSGPRPATLSICEVDEHLAFADMRS